MNDVNEHDEEYSYTNRDMDKNYDQTMAVTDTTHRYRDPVNDKRNTVAEDKAVFDNFGPETMQPRHRPLKSKNNKGFSDSHNPYHRESTIQYDQRSLPDSNEPMERPNYHLHHHHEQRISPHPSDERKVTPPMSPDYSSEGDPLDNFGELAGIPGNAGKDYPTLSKLPEGINFSCKDRTSGFYADPYYRCQV